MNEMSQNSPTVEQPTSVQPYKIGEFDAYISYLAIGGLTTTDDGMVKKISLEEFCKVYGVDRKTLYNWKRETPNIGELVRERREQLMPVARETAWFNQLHLLGMQTQDKRAAVDALKTLTGHFASLRLPSQEVKHEVGENFADLVSAHRQNERKIIDVTPTDQV